MPVTPRSRWCCGRPPSAPTPSTSPGLYRHRSAAAPRYHEIAAPTVVISGDRDTVVDEQSTASGLPATSPSAELVWVHNLGHKPDWIAPDLVLAGIENVAGLRATTCGLAPPRSRRGLPMTGSRPGRCAPKAAGKRRAGAPIGSAGHETARFRSRQARPSRYRRCAACWSRPGVLSGTPAVMMTRSPALREAFLRRRCGRRGRPCRRGRWHRA